VKILLCGCGALGSQIALHLARPEIEFVLVDDERVEETNIATSAYGQQHIGMKKVNALSSILWQKCGCKADPRNGTFDQYACFSVQHICPDLIIDAFDNSIVRGDCVGLAIIGWSVIHAGVSQDRTGEILWNKDYKLPTVRVPRGHNLICTHELGAPILRFTAALCANIVEDWIETGNERSVIITQKWEVLE